VLVVPSHSTDGDVKKPSFRRRGAVLGPARDDDADLLPSSDGHLPLDVTGLATRGKAKRRGARGPAFASSWGSGSLAGDKTPAGSPQHHRCELVAGLLLVPRCSILASTLINAARLIRSPPG
jgi:hypothetical protein